ncbi:MarR family transcriptional regulator [Robertmurraya korlensis]|uniref:MarR family winged helix-turn-helix transcriptional regulator n=1 Tax=Robertmurraya korlensis TaxID=519977 RepID=UPI002041AD0E|nr:MarR family transcriptional regulator [Robertmurraya korlensis]MCM3601263.1 MarR family transcriptional regulator [Robertmurraya korlensis]
MTHPLPDQEHILFLLKELSNQMGPKFERNTHISLSRYELLHQLYQVDEINQSSLQKVVNIDHAAITRHLKQLESEGMVSRRRNPSDNRETFVQLTHEGRERILTCQSDKLSFIKQMFYGFTEEELRSLVTMLIRVQTNIKEY